MSEPYIDEDDEAGTQLPYERMPGGPWQPEAWTKGPEQLEAEAKAMNAAGFGSAFANAGKHSNPPAHADIDRTF